MLLQNGARVEAVHLETQYAGGSPGGAGFSLVGDATLRLDDSGVRNSGIGIHAQGDGQQEVVINRVEIVDNANAGITVYQTNGGVYDSIFMGNGRALRVIGASFAVRGNTFTANVSPIELASHGVVLDYAGNAVEGNAVNAIRLEGDVTQDTTWPNYEGLPYYFDRHLTVHAGTTLTLEPGVIVKALNGAGGGFPYPEVAHSMFPVEGSLVAQGTADRPVVFTSVRDDVYGGDTNNDGDATAAGVDWGSIQVMDEANLTHFQVRHAGNTRSAGLELIQGATLHATHSRFMHGSNGISVFGSEPEVVTSIYLDDCVVGQNGGFGLSAMTPGRHEVTVHNSQFLSNLNNSGVEVNNAIGGIYDSYFQGNFRGVYVVASTFTLHNNSFVENIYPLQVYAHSVMLEYAGNTVEGNSVNAIRLEGDVTQDTTWPNYEGLPYYFDRHLTVHAGTTLTLEPGVIVKARGGGSGTWPYPLVATSVLFVYGNLVSQGITDDPVILTSVRDDAFGGDTNNDDNASSPGSGWPWSASRADWGGIVLTGEGILVHTHVRYAGFAQAGGVEVTHGALLDATFSTFFHNDTGIALTSVAPDGYARLRLVRSIVHESTGNGIDASGPGEHIISVLRSWVVDNNRHGIWANRATCRIVGSLIQANLDTGVWIEDTSLCTLLGNDITDNFRFGVVLGNNSRAGITAEYNWWGCPYGPSVIQYDPRTGDMVEGNVDYHPWLEWPENSPVTVEPPEPVDLMIGTPERFTIDVLASKLFRIQPESGRSFIVVLSVEGNPPAASQLRLLGKLGTPPTLTSSEYQGAYQPAVERIEILVQYPVANAYYFFVDGPLLGLADSVEVTIEAVYAEQLLLAEVAPTRASNHGTLTLGLRGRGFTRDAQVSLISAGGSRIAATN